MVRATHRRIFSVRVDWVSGAPWSAVARRRVEQARAVRVARGFMRPPWVAESLASGVEAAKSGPPWWRSALGLRLMVSAWTDRERLS